MAGLLIALAVAVAGYNYTSISSAFARAQQYYIARQVTWALLESLFREESALRGFTSTRDDQYLPSIRAANDEYDRQFGRLRASLWTVGVPGGRQYLSDMDRLHRQWRDRVVQPLMAQPADADATGRQRTGELLLQTLGDDVSMLNGQLDRGSEMWSRRTRMRVRTAIGEMALLTVLFGLTVMSMRRTSRRVERYYMAEITEANRTLTSAQRLAGVGNWTYDLKTGKTLWSSELFRIFGLVPTGAAAGDIRAYDHPEDAQVIREAVADFERTREPYRIDHRVVLADGSIRYVQEQAEVSSDESGDRARVIGTIVDVTERKLAEARLAYLAHHDALTGLPNRTMLAERLEHSLAYARRNGRYVAVLFLDLDRFKAINDTRGHVEGDELLRQVANRLRGVVRATDTVARSGGDEFIVVAGDVGGASDLLAIANAVHAAFGESFHLGDDDIFVNCSIGVSVFPRDGEDPDALIRSADAALYQAKDGGRDMVQYFTSDLVESASRRMSLEADMRRGLERGEFAVYYQPIIGLRTGSLVGVEALLRWHHNVLGVVAPDEFIPIAEESGFIVQLGEWVLRSACDQHVRWVAAGFDVARVTVNISARQFQHRDLETVVARVIRETGIAPGALELELTETSLMSDTTTSAATLRALRRMGVAISIDDFGIGYSSLGYLKSFPIDSLKIDRTFISDITEDRYDEAIASAIVALARSLGLGVIAEGIETQAQLTHLLRLGCDKGQGFLFGEPAPAENCVPMFARFASVPSGQEESA